MNSSFKYNRALNPLRVLTEPSERVLNNGFDNVNSNLVMCVNDILHSESGPLRSYRVVETLGEGTFGQVVRCEDCSSKASVAIKVIKNKPAYYNQALLEIAII
jgi:dual specificity protein kinase YAK1